MTGEYPVGTFVEDGRRYQVRLEARIEPAQLRATGATIDHEPIPADAVEFAISGSVYYAKSDGTRDRRYADCLSCGQVIDDLRKIKSPRAQHIADLWERWHLNGMRPNCAHMGHQTYTPGLACPAGLPLPQPDDNVSRRPAVYTSGSAWLFEPIPAEVLAELRQLFPNAG